MQRAEVTLDGKTSSVPEARKFVESVLDSWGHAELGWTASVCVSELAANCALHARTQFSVLVELGEDGLLRVEVSDSSQRLPTVRAYGTDATTGRELRLLERLVTRWGVRPSDGGKTVWLLIDTSLPSEDPDSDRAVASADPVTLLASFPDVEHVDARDVTRCWSAAA